MEAQERQHHRKQRNLSDIISTCAYFGIFDCDCCQLETKLSKSPKTKTFDKNAPSTSADTNSFNLNIEEEERRLKQYEEKLSNMMTSQTLCTEEEIDVVNDVPETHSLEPETNEDEEIDVVNINQEMLDKSTIEFDENLPLVLFLNKTNPLRANFTENLNISPQNEEEIDVVSVQEFDNAPLLNQDVNIVPVSFDENAPLSTLLPADESITLTEFDEDAPLSTYLNNPRRKRKKPARTQQIEEEIIDVVNLTDTPDYEILTENIIDITDSPRPKTFKEVITVEDDDSVPRKVSFGPCPVCLEDLSKCEVMSTMCGHVFCASCIKTVVKTIKKCPKCRKNLSMKSVHPLFF